MIKPHGNLGRRREGLAPVLTPSLLDIAWAAGVWEGDGAVSYNSGTVEVTVGQVASPEVPDLLRAFFGGRSSFYSYSYEPRNHVWLVTGSRARGFLMTIYRFLSVTRQQKVREILAK